MAKVKLIGCNAQRMIPCGAGWKVDGLFFATWSAAVTHLLDGEVPTAEQVEAAEDCRLELMIDAQDTINERIAERRMRNI